MYVHKLSGKTFDPTEWFNQQKEKRARSARIAWGSGSPRDGYSSDGSRGSRGKYVYIHHHLSLCIYIHKYIHTLTSVCYFEGSMRSMSAGSERSASARSIRSTASSQDSRISERERKQRIRERTR